MLINQEHLLEAIDVEIEYREQQKAEGISGVEEELFALRGLREDVEQQKMLSYPNYEWLCYMVHNNLQKDEEE